MRATGGRQTCGECAADTLGPSAPGLDCSGSSLEMGLGALQCGKSEGWPLASEARLQAPCGQGWSAAIHIADVLCFHSEQQLFVIAENLGHGKHPWSVC